MVHPVRCLPCGETMAAADIVIHVHRMHPAIDAWPERWPDGGLVVHEDPDLMAEA
jgi:hypothetical protein